MLQVYRCVDRLDRLVQLEDELLEGIRQRLDQRLDLDPRRGLELQRELEREVRAEESILKKTIVGFLLRLNCSL